MKTIETERYTLVNGDCLEYMRTLEDGAVDHTITDPPYDEQTHRGAVTHGGKNQSSDIGVNTFCHIDNPELIVKTLLRITARWGLCFCTFEDMKRYRDPAWELNAWVRSGVWDRVNPCPQFTGDRPSQACEGIAIFHNPNTRKRWNGGGNSAIWRYSVEFGKKIHVTQKPLSLMRHLVEDFSDCTDTVFDPFMGSGTTGVACMQLGRRFIGCEIDPGYFDIAAKRIADAATQPPLFTLDNTTEKAEQLGMFE